MRFIALAFCLLLVTYEAYSFHRIFSGLPRLCRGHWPVLVDRHLKQREVEPGRVEFGVLEPHEWVLIIFALGLLGWFYRHRLRTVGAGIGL